MYRVHKWLMVLLTLYQLGEPDFERTVRETEPGELAEEAGEFAFKQPRAMDA